MQSSDQEIARRVLASVLDRLKSEKDSDSAPPDLIQTQSPSNVFIIMLGDGQSGIATDDVASAQRDFAYKPSALGDSASVSHNSDIEAHPSLQRFDLPLHDTCSTAPRMCFMEPDRVCVNSGACRVLGN